LKNQQIEQLENEMKELKTMLNKALKIHPKTLYKINNQLNNSGVINNNIFNIIPLGKENLEEALTPKEQRMILNERGNCLTKLIEMVHTTEKFKQFNNVYITNLQNSIGYKYDSKTNNFIAVNKYLMINELIDCRIYDINCFYESGVDKLDKYTVEVIERFLKRMNDEDDCLRGLKKDEIKLLLYNTHEKIIKSHDIKEIEI
jgi:hypothetical protein